MQIQQSPLNRILMYIIVAVPWYGLFRILTSDISGLLIFVLLVILIPLVIAINLATIVAFKGREVVKQAKTFQDRVKQSKEPLTSTNYSELPWWNPRKYF